MNNENYILVEDAAEINRPISTAHQIRNEEVDGTIRFADQYPDNDPRHVLLEIQSDLEKMFVNASRTDITEKCAKAISRGGNDNHADVLLSPENHVELGITSGIIVKSEQKVYALEGQPIPKLALER